MERLVIRSSRQRDHRNRRRQRNDPKPSGFRPTRSGSPQSRSLEASPRNRNSVRGVLLRIIAPEPPASPARAPQAQRPGLFERDASACRSLGNAVMVGRCSCCFMGAKGGSSINADQPPIQNSVACELSFKSVDRNSSDVRKTRRIVAIKTTPSAGTLGVVASSRLGGMRERWGCRPSLTQRAD
jgi:hypothetical protein